MNLRYCINCFIAIGVICCNCYSMPPNAMFVVAHERYKQLEYDITKNVLTDAGVKTLVASDWLSDAIADDGKNTVNVNFLIEDVQPLDYDALIFIGWGGVQSHLDNKKCYALVRQAFKRKKIIAAISEASRILVNSRILCGKRVATNEVQKGGGVYRGKPVVVDGTIITANCSEAAQDFGRAIVKALFNS